MRSFALACLVALLAAPAFAQQPDSMEMDGRGPVLQPTLSTTLRMLKEDVAEGRATAAGMQTIDGLRISDCRKYDGEAPGDAAYMFEVHERATGESTYTNPIHGEIFFGTTDESIGEKIRANPRLARYDARVMFRIVTIPDDTFKPYYLALVSSIEWVDKNGHIIETAH